ncbi:MAG: glycosyltransferase [Acidimicrobiales bacterium]
MRRPATEGAPVRVTHVIDTLGAGGAERLLVTNLRYLDPARIRSSVVTVRADDDHWRAAIEELGVPVASLDAQGPLGLARAVLRLRHRLRGDDADVVHTHLQQANLVGRVAGRLAGVPVVSSLHNPDHEQAVWADEGFTRPWRQEVLRVLDAITARWCGKVIAVSAHVADSARRRLHITPNQLIVIPNAVELEPPTAGFTAPATRIHDELGLPDAVKVVLTVARVVPQKGLQDIIDALGLLPEDIHLLVAGSMANHGHAEALRDRSRRLGISDRVHLLGARSDVTDLLSACDAFVLASHYEGFGIALAEAMAAGRPCAVSDIEPFKALVDHHTTGLVFPAGSPSAIADSIRAILDDPAAARAMGTAAAACVRERLDPRTLAGRLSGLYEDVGEQGPAQARFERRVSCPLCGSIALGTSWWGATTFSGTRYEYLACRSCGSSFCDPMPDAATIEIMYGPEYISAASAEGEFRSDNEVTKLLSARPAGTFLDVGCGGGALLADVSRIGWEAVGIELDDDVAVRASRASGCVVLTPEGAVARGVEADVVHLGDLLEHLPDPLAGLDLALGFLRAGGLLLAQGPLEANRNMFLWSIRVARLRGHRKEAVMPPYHVLLATARGQEDLFERAALHTERYDVSEVAWPAPSRLAACKGSRDLLMFGARRVSIALSAVLPGQLGNRYFYVGIKR